MLEDFRNIEEMKATQLLFAIGIASTPVGAIQAAAGAPAGAGAAGAQADPANYPHVVELWNSDTTPAEKVLGVLTDKLGASREKAMAVVQKVDAKGHAVVLAGPKASCDEAAAFADFILDRISDSNSRLWVGDNEAQFLTIWVSSASLCSL